MSRKGKNEPSGTATGENLLIDSLPSRQRAGVLSRCEPVQMSAGEVLCKAGDPFQYVYFPIVGSIAMATTLPDGQTLETDSVGREGMLGAALALNINRAYQTGTVWAPCRAQRMKATRVRAALQSNPALFRILQRYMYVVLSELSQKTGCIHFHDVGRRLARELLLAHDRARGDHLSLTHMRLAEMIGVQRGAVTIAATRLQRDEIIRYSRGKIFILDHKRLEAASCGCYRQGVKSHALK